MIGRSAVSVGIPTGIPILTAESRAAVETEFLSPYPPMGIPMGMGKGWVWG